MINQLLIDTHNLNFQEIDKSDNYNSLIKKMKKSYISKSIKQKTYFYQQVAPKYNKLTKERILDLTDNKNFDSLKDIYDSLRFKVDENDNLKILDEMEELPEGQYLRNQDNQYGNKKIAKVKYLEYYNQNKKGYFITWTLPSKFHKYKQKRKLKKEERHYEDFKALILNPKYEFDNFEECLESGLEMLKKIHRHFYLEIKRRIHEDNNLEEIDFIKIIEPHKSLTPHQHVLFWVSEKYEDIVKNAFKLTIEKFELNEDFQDLEIINTNIAKASTYITKYISKSFTKDTEQIDFYNYYKRYFGKKYKFFTTSNFKTKGLTQEKMNFMYKYLNKHNKIKMNAIKKCEKPIYIYLELLYKYEYFTFQEEKIQSFRVNKQYLNKLFDELIEENKPKRIRSKKEIINFFNTYKISQSTQDWYWSDKRKFENIEKKRDSYINQIKSKNL